MPGDDIYDDFVPDDLIAQSDAADSADENSEDWSGVSQPPAGPSTVATPDNAQSAKRKRRIKEKERKAKKQRLAEPSADNSLPSSISSMSPGIIHQYLLKQQSKVLKDLTEIELDDWRIPEDCIINTTAWVSPRTLDQLPEFISKILPTLKTRLGQRPKSVGAPTVLYIAGAALRVADATRMMKRIKDESKSAKAGEVAKLFGKHFKLEEHAQYLRKTRVGSAVGTPGRIGKLLCETTSLSVSALSHILIDASFEDAKKRNIFDIPETRDELFRLVLGAESVRERLASGSLALVLF